MSIFPGGHDKARGDAPHQGAMSGFGPDRPRESVVEPVERWPRRTRLLLTTLLAIAAWAGLVALVAVLLLMIAADR